MRSLRRRRRAPHKKEPRAFPRHSEAKGRRIRIPRPRLPQAPHGRRNAFRGERTSKEAERVFAAKRKQSKADFARTKGAVTEGD